MQQFVQVLADHQHRGAAIAGVDEPAMDLGDGDEVQSEDRVADQQHLGVVRQFPRQHRALDVAAGQRADRCVLVARAHAEGSDQGAGPFGPRARPQPAPAREGRHIVAAQRHVVGHAHRGHTAVAQGLFGQAAHLQRAVLRPRGPVIAVADAHRARRAQALPGQRLHQLALAVAGHPGDADDLAGAHVQVEPVHRGLAAIAFHAQAADLQAHRPGGCGCARQRADRVVAGLGLRLGAGIGAAFGSGARASFPAHHRLGQFGRPGLRHRQAAHMPPPPQHRHVVGKGTDLAELVRDHHDAALAGVGALAQRAQHLVGLLRRQHRRGLVQDQQARAQEQLLEDLQLLLLPGRQVRRRRVQV